MNTFLLVVTMASSKPLLSWLMEKIQPHSKKEDGLAYKLSLEPVPSDSEWPSSRNTSVTEQFTSPPQHGLLIRLLLKIASWIGKNSPTMTLRLRYLSSVLKRLISILFKRDWISKDSWKIWMPPLKDPSFFSTHAPTTQLVTLFRISCPNDAVYLRCWPISGTMGPNFGPCSQKETFPILRYGIPSNFDNKSPFFWNQHC